MSTIKVYLPTIPHAGQDHLHGVGIRVCNVTTDRRGDQVKVRCTVDGSEHWVSTKS